MFEWMNLNWKSFQNNFSCLHCLGIGKNQKYTLNTTRKRLNGFAIFSPFIVQWTFIEFLFVWIICSRWFSWSDFVMINTSFKKIAINHLSCKRDFQKFLCIFFLNLMYVRIKVSESKSVESRLIIRLLESTQIHNKRFPNLIENSQKSLNLPYKSNRSSFCIVVFFLQKNHK